MTTMAELEAGFRAAHAAGDRESAAKFAGAIRKTKEPFDRSEVTSPDQRYYNMMSEEVDEKSTSEKFLEGAASGIYDSMRSTANFVLPKSMQPEWATDEDIKQGRDLMKPLTDTTAGGIGNVAGQVLAVAAPGAGVGGAVVKGGQLLSKAGRPAGGLLKTLGGAAEGATAGAIMADPGERGTGAALGAGIGAGVTGVGQVLKKVLGGPTRMTPEAQVLQKKGVEVPLGLGAEKGVLKSMYREFLPVVPFTGKPLLRQSEKAFDQWRNLMSKTAIPKWVPKEQAAKMLDETNPQAAMANLQKFWEKEAYKELYPMVFRTSQKWLGKEGMETLGTISPKVRETFTKQIQMHADDAGNITGKDLMQVRTNLADLAQRSRSDSDVAFDLFKASSIVDSMLKRQLLSGASKTSKGKGIYKRWRQNSAPYAKFLDLQKATHGSAKEAGKYLPTDLMKASATRAGERRGAAAGGALQKTAQAGERGLGKPLFAPGLWRTLAGLGVAGATALSPTIALPLILGTGSALSTKTMQKALTGNLAAQKSLTKLLRDNPKLAAAVKGVGTAGQAGIISQGVQ